MTRFTVEVIVSYTKRGGRRGVGGVGDGGWREGDDRVIMPCYSRARTTRGRINGDKRAKQPARGY